MCFPPINGTWTTVMLLCIFNIKHTFHILNIFYIKITCIHVLCTGSHQKKMYQNHDICMFSHTYIMILIHLFFVWPKSRHMNIDGTSTTLTLYINFHMKSTWIFLLHACQEQIHKKSCCMNSIHIKSERGGKERG